MLKCGRLVHRGSRLLLTLIMAMLTLPHRRLARSCLELAIVNFEVANILVVGAEKTTANAASVSPQMHALLLRVHLEDKAVVETVDSVLILLETLLQLLRFVKHDTCVV